MAIDPNQFKETMAHWASGVTVVTTRLGDETVGITVSSFVSVSLTPPQILVCIAKKLHTHAVVEQSRVFAVNVLGVEHLELGMRFAGMFPEITDRFAGLGCFNAETGCPLLPGVLGWLDCRVSHIYDGGDHSIFVGEVVASDARDSGAPILYYNRNWRELAPEPLALK